MVLVVNKRAHHDYTISQTFQAGVVLSGAEVKSLRQKHASLTGSYVKVINTEAFLLNAQINAYPFANQNEYDPKRTRKLLLKKRELLILAELSQRKNIGLVPLSFELVANHIKLNLGVGRGKKLFEKRADLKKQDLERDIAKELKQRVRIH